MNKFNLLFTFCIALFSFAQAQTPPNAFNYSAVARNAAGQPIASATIGLQISILKTSTTGAVQYSENHTVTTDAFGLFNLAIGAGSVQSGSMSNITWGTDIYYIKIGMDVTGGTNFLTMGTTQLMSVPYALHAKTAETLVSGGTNTVGKTYIELFGDITNAQADSTLKADLGPNTQFVYITNTTKLTSIDLSSIKALMELSITANEVLTTVNASSLTRCTKNFDISTNPLLATIQTDKITFLGDVNITQNAKLTAINFPLLKKARNINVQENPIISNFSAVLLTIANEVDIDNNNSLTTINFSALTTLSGGLYIEDNAILSTLNISLLKTAKLIRIYSNGLTSLSLSALTTLSESFDINDNKSLSSLATGMLNSADYISIQGNGLTSLSFPSLTTLNRSISISNNVSMTTLSFPALTTLKSLDDNNIGISINISSNILLNALNISSLSKIPSFYAYQNKLSNITWAPQITSWSNINLESNALPSSEINEILALVVAAGQSAHSGTNTSLNLYQTPAAPPTGQGITDKETIVVWGVVSVYTN